MHRPCNAILHRVTWWTSQQLHVKSPAYASPSKHTCALMLGVHHVCCVRSRTFAVQVHKALSGNVGNRTSKHSEDQQDNSNHVTLLADDVSDKYDANWHAPQISSDRACGGGGSRDAR